MDPLGLLDREDRDDVRMIERGYGLGFSLEAHRAIRIARERLGEDFQRDVTIQLCVAGSVDFTHPARA